jgi:alpha-N-arabinofuranosidase
MRCVAPISPIVNARGPLFVHPKGIVKRTTFHVMQMYANELGPNVVPLELESDMLPEPASRVKAVDAVATCDDSKTNWRIVVINRDPERAAEVKLDLGNRALDGSYPAIVLSGDGPDAYNDIDRPDRVTPESLEVTMRRGRVTVPAHSLIILSVKQ